MLCCSSERDPGNEDEDDSEDDVPLARLLTAPAAMHAAPVTGAAAQETELSVAAAQAPANKQPPANKAAPQPSVLLSTSGAAPIDGGLGYKDAVMSLGTAPISQGSAGAASDHAQIHGPTESSAHA